MHKITIGWMYPNLLNLHGERGSVQALVKIASQLGVEAQVVRIEDFNDPIPFEKLDLLIFLPGEISTFQYLIPALQTSGLREYLEQDGYVVAIGTSGLMFGNTILREDGSTVNGLGYLDMTATERRFVWGDDLHCRLNDSDMELIGSQIQMADVDAQCPLATTIYGMGNNNSGAEGARWKNLIYTNCLGPLFVQNPWFGETILREISQKKHIELTAETDCKIAKDSFRSVLEFINSKI